MNFSVSSKKTAPSGFFTALTCEIRKTKMRLAAIYLPVAAILFFWIFYNYTDPNDWLLQQGYYYGEMGVLLLNSIFLPITVALAASRLCDCENKGNNWKLLCTFQKKSSLLHAKLVLGSLYLVAFHLGELFLLFFLSRLHGFTQTFEPSMLAKTLFTSFASSIFLFLLQMFLSLFLTNQLYPLFIGILGTFIGLFSWFMPLDLPIRFLPWGFFCVGCPVMLTSSPDTDPVYTAMPYPFGAMALFCAAGVILYLVCRYCFVNKKEV